MLKRTKYAWEDFPNWRSRIVFGLFLVLCKTPRRIRRQRQIHRLWDWTMEYPFDD